MIIISNNITINPGQVSTSSHIEGGLQRVAIPGDLPSDATVGAVIYVSSTTSIWEKTSDGWIDSEADVKNIEYTDDPIFVEGNVIV